MLVQRLSREAAVERKNLFTSEKSTLREDETGNDPDASMHGDWAKGEKEYMFNLYECLSTS